MVNFLLTYMYISESEGVIKTYKWFETEEDMNDFIIFELAATSRIVGKMEIFDARHIK